MGTFGINSFENDLALDWLDDFVESTNPLEILSDAIQGALAGEYVEADEGQAAICAAEIVYSLLSGKRKEDTPEELEEWLDRNSDLNVTNLKEKCVQSLRRLLTEVSELNELWQEDEEEYPRFSRNVEELISSLDSIPNS